MRIALLTSCFLLVASAQALTDTWGVDVQQHTAVQRTYKQGETWSIQITLRDGLKSLDLTGATAKWYWYTNTTANIWWTNSAAIPAPKSGIVTAQWTPAMDVGASSYAYWVGIWMPGATSPLWRVTGNIRMLPSPGFTPNALPMPIRTLDFAAIALTNAPWVTSADWSLGSNALASALQAGFTNAAAQLSSATGALAIATSANLSAATGALWRASETSLSSYAATGRVTRLQSTDGTRWIDGTGGVWQVTWQTGYTATNAIVEFDETVGSNYYYLATDATYIHYGENGQLRYTIASGLWEYADLPNQPFSQYSPYGSFSYPAIGTLQNYLGDAIWFAAFTYAVTTRVDTVLYESDGRALTNGLLTAQAALGIVYSNAVSQLTVYTNQSGAATSMVYVASGVTNHTAFGSGYDLPDNILTNNISSATIGGLAITGNALWSPDATMWLGALNIGSIALGGRSIAITGTAAYQDIDDALVGVWSANGTSYRQLRASSVAIGPNGSTAPSIILATNGTVTAKSFAATTTGVTYPNIGTNTFIRTYWSNSLMWAEEVAQ